MFCVLIGLVVVGFAAHVVSGIVCRLSGATGNGNLAIIRAASFVATFVTICLAVAIFVSKFRFTR